ncbi:MAG: hypothetical protein OXP36_13935 [Gammaproteobacteria bacterium]|nr:hypothetical protein [Gammaproteobacteria bacterium]
MKNDPERKREDFDCVASMRKIRDGLSAEIAGMPGAELRRWFNSREYSDPILRRFAGRAKRPASGNDKRPK